ncbi:MAG: hypothetical protein GXP17_10630 [Gammaproteobacteria bacterium]|nr:hypothetical protein [Gammaproteobacteria bacterium]
MPNYRIVLDGELLPGFEQTQAQEDFAATFRLSDPVRREQALSKVFSGKPMVFKKGLSQGQAQSFEVALNRIGLSCQIEVEELLLEEPMAVVDEPAVATDTAPPVSSEHAIGARATVADESSASQNPYQQPAADLDTASPQKGWSFVEPKKLSAGEGYAWIREGFDFFKQNPGTWIAMILVFLVLNVAISLIPLLSIVGSILNGVFLGGFMLACYKQSQDEDISVGDLFAGFKNRFGRLAGVGAVYMISIILIFVVMIGAIMGAMGTSPMTMMAGMDNPALMAGSFSLLLLLAMGLMIPIIMAYLFAPALVVFHDVTVLEAMKLSFRGCLRNTLPFLVYGIVAMFLGIIAAIPLGLGYLVLMPVLTAAIFVAYRDIYTEPTDS